MFTQKSCILAPCSAAEVNSTPVQLRATLPNREGCRIQKHHPDSGAPAYQAPSCELTRVQAVVGFRVHTSLHKCTYIHTYVQTRRQVHMCIHTSVCASWQPDRQTDRQSQATVRRVQSPFADTFLISASLCEAMCVHPRQVVHTYIHTCFSNSKLDPLACNRGHEQSTSLSKLDPLVCTKQMTRSVNRLCSRTQVWYPPLSPEEHASRRCSGTGAWDRIRAYTTCVQRAHSCPLLFKGPSAMFHARLCIVLCVQCVVT